MADDRCECWTSIEDDGPWRYCARCGKEHTHGFLHNELRRDLLIMNQLLLEVDGLIDRVERLEESHGDKV